MIKNRVFKPGLLPSTAFIIIFPALIMLGFWQLDRAEQKEAIYVSYLKKTKEPPLNLNLLSSDEVTEDEIWRKAEAVGTFIQDGHVLLDNQVQNGVPGYFLYTLFQFEAENKIILVNRGWIAAGAYRDTLPVIQTPTGKLVLRGTVKPVPETGIVLGDNLTELFPGNIKRVQRLVLDDIEKKEGVRLIQVILRLDGESSYGYSRNWQEPGSGKEKHQGYAFQWFALAGVLLVIFLLLNTRKIDNI